MNQGERLYLETKHIKNLCKPHPRVFGWEVIFGCTMFGILLGIIIMENVK